MHTFALYISKVLSLICSSYNFSFLRYSTQVLVYAICNPGHNTTHFAFFQELLLLLLSPIFLSLYFSFPCDHSWISTGSQGPGSNNLKWLGRELHGRGPVLPSNSSTQKEWKEKNRAPWRQESLKSPFSLSEAEKVLFMTFTTRFRPLLKNNKEFGISV